MKRETPATMWLRPALQSRAAVDVDREIVYRETGSAFHAKVCGREAVDPSGLLWYCTRGPRHQGRHIAGTAGGGCEAAWPGTHEPFMGDLPAPEDGAA